MKESIPFSPFVQFLVSAGMSTSDAGLTDLARYDLLNSPGGRRKTCERSWANRSHPKTEECYVSPSTGETIHACGWKENHPGVCMCPCMEVNLE